jgi:hypothetical protein
MHGASNICRSSAWNLLHYTLLTPGILNFWKIYRGADKSLARPTSPCILFHGENTSFNASLVYIYSTNIPPIMIINRLYENQNLLSLACFLPGRAKDLSAPPVYINSTNIPPVMIIIGYTKIKIFCHCSLFPSWSG